MGGRGAASGGSAVLPEAILADLPYTVTSFNDDRGGATFPFLEQTGRAWRILTRPVDESTAPHAAHTFGLAAPTLRWVNGSQVSDLYVDGMTTAQFLEATGLQLDMHKGGFVLSKRISRLMRPHFVSGFFAPEEVRVAYMAQSPMEAKVWDGAGLISRRMLRKMMLSEDLTPAKRERLETELRHAQRVEFTVMTPKGQDKGHAIVADDLRDENGRPVDFLLPQDTKKEVRLDPSANDLGRRSGPRTFVGLSFVHGHNDMRLDIQSLINLHPFFQEDKLLDWLKDEGSLFVQAVETGQVAEAMGRIDRHTTLDEVQAWPLREYFASGGHPMWFRSHVKSLLNQHLKRLNHSTLAKMRLPIPGGRHYVMPAAVAQRAGIKGLDVPRGYIHIDDKRGTAWVNDDDWLALPDSPKRPGSPGEGIAGILGGADNDDALWLHPFTDHDGQRKVLAWRSPNQVGEYVILKPTADSQALPWTTSVNDVRERETAVYPPADSRKLPPRVDFVETAYLGLVTPDSAGNLDAGEAYSVDVMETAVAQAIANQGALGMYCNSLMLNKALYGRLPDNPPAPLEDIIDSAVKTGADLSRVVLWNYANSREILESKTPIPALLHQRLSVDWSDTENRPPPPRTSNLIGAEGHWLDRLEAGVKEHIQAMQEKRDELVSQARPLQAVLDAALADPEAVQLGAGLNKAYATALRMGKGQYASVLERARVAAEDYLAHFPPEQRGAILLGALASVYGKEDGRADTAVWLAGSKEETGSSQPGVEQISIAHQTIEALRGIGLLDHIISTKEGVVVYPAEMMKESSDVG
ncbi:MAG: hypothetical protein H6659_18415 [Ardenticatenaceae bacterium]|nr:hypothetical protein [Ardenticatenaceae bacterium]